MVNSIFGDVLGFTFEAQLCIKVYF